MGSYDGMAAMRDDIPGRTWQRAWRPVLRLLLGGHLVLAATAASAQPAYDHDHAGTFLPYLPAPERGGPIAQSPRLGLSFGGEVRPVLMDTGSTGIVVSASRIPNRESLPSRPGQLTYSSSGRIMIGHWVTTPVTLRGADGSSVTTRPIPVLAVDRIACTRGSRHCTPEEAPRHVAMMGVGFGRENDSQSQSTPETNPLLNVLSADHHPIRRGYVVTRRGVHVGLTAANTRGAFRFAKLDPHPAIPGEWQGVPVCIAVDDRTPPACGRALIDTGVTAMFLTLPPEQVADSLEPGRTDLRTGTRLSFRFPADAVAGSAPAASYTIVLGETDSPVAPERVVLNTRRPTPFVNTGLRFLNGFDVLYDADDGWYGFRARDGNRPDDR